MRRLDGWGTGRRSALVAGFVAALLGLAWAWPSLDASARAALLLTDGVLRLPGRPLTWVTRDPVVEELRWDGGHGILRRPDAEEPVAGLVLTLGADPAPPDDPRVVRLTETLARLGIAVLLPVSEPLDAGVVSSSEVDRLAGAVHALRRHEAVADDRIAIAGLSVGGSLAIVAASRLADAVPVRFVLAVGPYYDAASLVASTSGQAVRTPDGGVVPWEPHRTTRKVVRATLLSTLSPDERAAIEAGGQVASEDGRRIAALLGGLPLPEAEAAVAALSDNRRCELERVSPRFAHQEVQAPLYLLHDRADEYIPWQESAALYRGHGAEVYHRLDLFRHVDADVGSLDVLTRDGWRLFRLFSRVFRDLR